MRWGHGRWRAGPKEGVAVSPCSRRSFVFGPDRRPPGSQAEGRVRGFLHRSFTLHRTPRVRPQSSRAGLTLIELVVVMAVMTVAVSMFTSMVIATARQRGVNRENAVASNAARVMVELMRNEEFEDVYALYNEDPDDDPGGPGTAPGHRFAVQGLTPLDSSPDGLIGEIEFPEMFVEVEVAPLGGLGKLGGLLPPTTEWVWQLREDYQDARMGMPRDLNGDSMIDDQGHNSDYVILPVHVQLRWRGRFGDRVLDLYTQIAAFKK